MTTGWHGVGWHQSIQCRADRNCAMLTPHMEAALKEGIELDQHYTYRFCSPTRAALMTGRLPIHVNQMNSAEYPWTAAAMHPSFVTVADALRSKAGYATHQLGKWHVSTVPGCGPRCHSHCCGCGGTATACSLVLRAKNLRQRDEASIQVLAVSLYQPV